MRRALIFLLIFSVVVPSRMLAEGSASLDDAYALIDSQYPGYRLYWGCYSVVAGLYGGAFGIVSLLSAQGDLGSIMGFGLSFSSWLIFFDGVRLLWDQTEIEYVSRRYLNYAPGEAKDFGGVVSRDEFGRTRLRVLADEAYTGRILRMLAHIISGASMLYFFGTGPGQGSRNVLVPGIIFLGVGGYRLYLDSPEEKGQRMVSGVKISFVPGLGGAYWVMRF